MRGLFECIVVEAHLTSRPVQVLPEGEGRSEVAVAIDQAVESESKLVVL